MIEELEARSAVIAGMGDVVRLLPRRQRRTIGAWCFFDHFGPTATSPESVMEIGPHPHVGIETFTWIFSGELLHHDSLGNHTLIRPGDLNVMTAGQGVAHAEESPLGRSHTLHGIQLWVVLPAKENLVEPRFAHHVGLPLLRVGSFELALFAGSFDDASAPYEAFSPLFGAELTSRSTRPTTIGLDQGFEHGVVLISGQAELNGVPLMSTRLAYLALGTGEITLTAAPGTKLIVLGGPPFTDRFVMWWNLIAPNEDEIARARYDWISGNRFGVVRGARGPRVEAPKLPTGHLRARGATPDTLDR